MAREGQDFCQVQSGEMHEMLRGTKIILVTAIFTAVIISFARGGINRISFWNSTPLPIALLTLLVDKSQREIRYAIYGFSFSIVFLLLAVHMSILFDIESTVAVASLLPLKSIGGPLYIIAAGYMAGMVGVVVGVVKESEEEKC